MAPRLIERTGPMQFGEPYRSRAQALGGPSQRTLGTLEQYGPLGADNRRRQLGRSVELLADVSAPRAARFATLIYAGASRAERAGPSVGEALSQQMVITCSKELLGTLEANSKARVLGHLTWGNDGHASEASFEILEGVTVRPVGSFARLVAELVECLDGAEPTTDVRVGAFVGYGESLATAPATLSDYAVTTAPAPTASFFVPPFAVGWKWWANTTLGVEWLDGTTVLFAGLGAAAQPLATRGELMPIPPATTLRVTPSAPGNLIITWVLAV